MRFLAWWLLNSAKPSQIWLRWPCNQLCLSVCACHSFLAYILGYIYPRQDKTCQDMHCALIPLLIAALGGETAEGSLGVPHTIMAEMSSSNVMLLRQLLCSVVYILDFVKYKCSLFQIFWKVTPLPRDATYSHAITIFSQLLKVVKL